MQPTNNIRTILVTDCGSTTTKALLFELKGNNWHQTFRGEAPTTVEEPVADVTAGAINAFQEIEELSGRKILRDGYAIGESPFIFSEADSSKGIDLYLSTSSAGGGLQMLVCGVVASLTTQSAERAALGAGAIVMEALSADDGRPEHERVERIRHLKPDIVLLTGGIDGGTKAHVIEMAEVLASAAPRPRFGDTLRLPVIYAGNKEAVNEVKEVLERLAQIVVVPNVRPQLDRENLIPAREAIHEFFLSHVMSHSPGYGKLISWASRPIIPTPAAVGDVVQRFAKSSDLNVLCADIGGATTDVFSVFKNHEGEQIFNRTVSANLGMSYSIANVLVETGIDNIKRWMPIDVPEEELRVRLRNKMIRPTSIPQTMEDLWVEQAVCREALNLSLKHHRSLAVGLGGVTRKKGIADLFSQSANQYQLVDLMKLDIVIGSGGVLSHAPSRMSAALMMIDGFELQGVTELAVDSIFMMPHLGILGHVNQEAADQIFIRDCLIRLGVCVSPVKLRGKAIETLARVLVNGEHVADVKANTVSSYLEANGKDVIVTAEPLDRTVDVGAGPGKVFERSVHTGECGIILDGRNRPIKHLGASSQVATQSQIFTNLGLKQK